MADSKNILVGAAAFYISENQDLAATITALAAPATVKAETAIEGVVGQTWKSPGYTDGGVEVSYEPTYGDVTVDQLLDSARIFKSGMKVTVNTTFSEATLENLLVVWGQSSTSLASDVLNIEGGELGDAPAERALAFVGPGPRAALSAGQKRQRVYLVERAIQTQTSAHALKRDAASTLPVSFRCLPNDLNKYGSVRDRAYTA